jgi:hypothetical protein
LPVFGNVAGEKGVAVIVGAMLGVSVDVGISGVGLGSKEAVGCDVLVDFRSRSGSSVNTGVSVGRGSIVRDGRGSNVASGVGDCCA